MGRLGGATLGRSWGVIREVVQASIAIGPIGKKNLYRVHFPINGFGFNIIVGFHVVTSGRSAVSTHVVAFLSSMHTQTPQKQIPHETSCMAHEPIMACRQTCVCMEHRQVTLHQR